MSVAVRCLFFVLALGALAVFVYLYRRRVNWLLAAVLLLYAVGAGRRLLSADTDEDVLVNGALALGGLGLTWLGVWVVARWLERRGLRDFD